MIVARFEGEGLTEPNGDESVGHAVFPLPGSATPVTPRMRFSTEGITAPLRRRSTGSTPAAVVPDPPVTEETPVVTPRPISTRGRTILFLVAAILLVIGALLMVRMFRSGVIHRTQPEPVHPTPADSGVRA